MDLNRAKIIREAWDARWAVSRLHVAVLAIGAISLLGWATPADSQDLCEPDQSNPSNAAEDCITPRPTPSRLRPTFSEEEERGLQERSFADSFLSDALTGMADPLGSSSVGGDVEGDSILDELEPGDRGFTLEPGFDPTNVIIPLDAVSK